MANRCPAGDTSFWPVLRVERGFETIAGTPLKLGHEEPRRPGARSAALLRAWTALLLTQHNRDKGEVVRDPMFDPGDFEMGRASPAC